MRNRVVAVARCLFLVALAGCRVPLQTPSVFGGTAPGACGLPAAGATAAFAGSVASSRAAADPVARADPFRTSPPERAGADRTWTDRSRAGPDAPGPDDVALAESGRLNLFADPGLVWMAQDPQAQEPQQPAESRWSDFLPLGREAVLAAGYELPRAFGFGVAYTRLRRDIEVNEVRVGLAGAPLHTVDFLSVEADSVVDNVMGRLDAWIFPFWNVSVLGGWTWNESTSQVTVNIPLPINPSDVTFSVPTHQDGPTWGFGTNLSAGYGQWFVNGDGTWIYADMNDFSRIEGFLGSIRSGWNGKVDGKALRLWGGVTYWDTATTISGSAPTSAGPLRFEVEQGPVTPYSLQVGGNVEFDRTYGIMLEGHLYRDVQMLVVSAAVRF